MGDDLERVGGERNVVIALQLRVGEKFRLCRAPHGIRTVVSKTIDHVICKDGGTLHGSTHVLLVCDRLAELEEALKGGHGCLFFSPSKGYHCELLCADIEKSWVTGSGSGLAEAADAALELKRQKEGSG